MREDLYTCDICDKKTRGIVDRAFIVTGRERTPAGSPEDVGEHLDLCPGHWKAMALNFSSGRGKDVLHWVKIVAARIKK